MRQDTERTAGPQERKVSSIRTPKISEMVLLHDEITLLYSEIMSLHD